MFDLVNDLESYAKFLPWCKQALVDSATEDELQGTIHLSKAGVNQSFTTLNKLRRPEQIEMELVKGPFSQLHGVWNFKPLSDDACKVSLQLEFSFNNTILEKVVGPVFTQIANTMLDAFVTRANELYGENNV